MTHIKRILIIIILLSAGLAVNQASAACGIDSATISPSTQAGSFDNSFYSESTAQNKEVTITVTTHECANKQPVYVSLTQYDTLERPTDSNGFHATQQTADTMHDVSGNTVSGNPNVRILDKKKINFSTNSFKITLHPGEDLCGIAVGTADCRYSVRVGLSKDTYDYFSRNTIQENNPRPGGNLDYDCDGLCNNTKPWQFVKVVTIPDVVVPGEPPTEPKNEEPKNNVPVVPNQFSSGVNDACSGGDCYSLFSGFADALGNKFSSIKDADSLSGLINAIIAFGIGLGGVLAVAMIMYQGFLYMKSDNVTTLTAIKGKIINTILGFLLLLTIYTILRTINPDLLNLNIGLDKITLSVADGQDTNEALDTAIQTNPEVAKIYSTSKGHWRDGGRVNPNTEAARRALAQNVPQSDLASIDNGEIAIKSGAGKFVHKSVAPKIIALNRALKQQGVYITVTEAFKPTTYMHYAACQYTSTCIDAALPFNAPKVAAFIAEGQKQGLVVVWETKSKANYTALIKQGVPQSNVLLFTGHITGDHASVYDYQ